jgi:hypothetical protein
MDFKTGNQIVSSAGDYSSTVIESMKRKAKCFIGLEEILKAAGFNIIEDGDEREPGIDFTKLEKDTFVKLLSDEG